MAALTYRVTAKGWELLHIEGMGVTQVRELAEAAQQVVHYVATLQGIEIEGRAEPAFG